MKTLLLATATCLALASGTAHAAECNSAQTQRDMNECFTRVLKAAEAELNHSLDEVMGRARNLSQKTLVQNSQSAWVVYRNKHCEFMASGVKGGSVYPTIISMCLADLTRARNKELRSSMNCAEGDLGCPL